MSWQAMSAVNEHSQQTHLGRFRLLLFLADHADGNGRVDPAPNQATQAEKFACSNRTIRTWIAGLVDSGELVQTRVGSGPGAPSAFQIALPMPTATEPKAEVVEPKAEVKGGKAEVAELKAEVKGGKAEDLSQKAEVKPVITSAFADLKAEVEALKAEVTSLKGGKAEANPVITSAFADLKAEVKAEVLSQKAEAKGGKGGSNTPSRRKCLSTETVYDPFDPSLIHKEGDPPPPPLPVVPIPKRPKMRQSTTDETTAVGQRVTTILEVCGLSRDIPRHLSRAENAAVQLDGFAPADIIGRYAPAASPNGSWYWYRDFWKGSKGEMPTPEDIVNTITLRRQTAVAAGQRTTAIPAVDTGLQPDANGLI
jgi:hypothetical protein